MIKFFLHFWPYLIQKWSNFHSVQKTLGALGAGNGFRALRLYWRIYSTYIFMIKSFGRRYFIVFIPQLFRFRQKQTFSQSFETCPVIALKCYNRQR